MIGRIGKVDSVEGGDHGVSVEVGLFLNLILFIH